MAEEITPWRAERASTDDEWAREGNRSSLRYLPFRCSPFALQPHRATVFLSCSRNFSPALLRRPQLLSTRTLTRCTELLELFLSCSSFLHLLPRQSRPPEAIFKSLTVDSII
jgi:hypothetical protein